MQCASPLDVLDHNHRVIDDESNRHRQPAKAHQVERIAREHEAK